MKRHQIVIIICFIIGVFFVTIDETLRSKEPKYIQAKLNDVQLRLETAENSAEWYQGLSNRTKLCQNCGMIFIFPETAKRTFVMRSMNFSLDIVWVNNYEVIGFEKSLTPENEPYTQYKSSSPVNMVIELPAGFIEKNKIELGTKLIIL